MPSRNMKRIEKDRTRTGDSARIGENIQILRSMALMTQAELANKAGVAPRTLQRVESGVYVRKESLLKIFREVSSVARAMTKGTATLIREINGYLKTL